MGGTSRSYACWDQSRSSPPRDACSICPARASAGCLPGWPPTSPSGSAPNHQPRSVTSSGGSPPGGMGQRQRQDGTGLGSRAASALRAAARETIVLARERLAAVAGRAGVGAGRGGTSPRAGAAGRRGGPGRRVGLAGRHRGGRGGDRQDDLAGRVRPRGTGRGLGGRALRTLPGRPRRAAGTVPLAGRASGRARAGGRAAGPCHALRRAPGSRGATPGHPPRTHRRGGQRRRDRPLPAVRGGQRRADAAGRDQPARLSAGRHSVGRANRGAVAPPSRPPPQKATAS